MSDDWEDETRFGDQASFLWKLGGDIFGNGSYASYRCNLCNRYFKGQSVGFFSSSVMGIYTREAPSQHAMKSSSLSSQFEELQRLHGVCTCSYHADDKSFMDIAPYPSTLKSFQERLREIRDSQEELNAEDSEDDD